MAKKHMFFMVEKKNKSIYRKIVNVFSETKNTAKSLFLLGDLTAPGYGPGLASVNFEVFLINDDYLLFAM